MHATRSAVDDQRCGEVPWCSVPRSTPARSGSGTAPTTPTARLPPGDTDEGDGRDGQGGEPDREHHQPEPDPGREPHQPRRAGFPGAGGVTTWRSLYSIARAQVVLPRL